MVGSFHYLVDKDITITFRHSKGIFPVIFSVPIALAACCSRGVPYTTATSTLTSRFIVIHSCRFTPTGTVRQGRIIHCLSIEKEFKRGKKCEKSAMKKVKKCEKKRKRLQIYLEIKNIKTYLGISSQLVPKFIFFRTGAIHIYTITKI